MPASACPIRDQLFKRFSELLNQYNRQFNELAEIHGFDHADAATSAARKACVDARAAIHAHEYEHGCQSGNKVKTAKSV